MWIIILNYNSGCVQKGIVDSEDWQSFLNADSLSKADEIECNILNKFGVNKDEVSWMFVEDEPEFCNLNN